MISKSNHIFEEKLSWIELLIASLTLSIEYVGIKDKVTVRYKHDSMMLEPSLLLF